MPPVFFNELKHEVDFSRICLQRQRAYSKSRSGFSVYNRLNASNLRLDAKIIFSRGYEFGLEVGV